jgi:uncharacterized membrane protein
MWYHRCMNLQKIGNAFASILFFVIAIYDYTHDSSGIGTVFLVFGAVYLGITLSAKKR